MTAAELIAQAAKRLSDAGVPEPELDAKILFLEAFHMDQVHFLMNRMRPLTEEQRTQQETYEAMIDRRSARVPLQQILGSQEFMGLTFRVTPDVLIPRQDTETLVEQVLQEQKDPDIRLLDLCTGSGCILLSLLHYSNDCEGTGVDISKEALQVAALNAELLGIKADFLKSDLYEKVTGKFDLLVSNPPYIERKVIPTLMEEVREYDPYIALDGGEDGLDFYRRIIGGAQDYLKRGGQILMEIGSGQAQAVSELLREAGFKEIDVCRDFAGLDRVVSGRLPIL